jgi:hypothetical protein
MLWFLGGLLRRIIINSLWITSNFPEAVFPQSHAVLGSLIFRCFTLVASADVGRVRRIAFTTPRPLGSSANNSLNDLAHCIIGSGM